MLGTAAISEATEDFGAAGDRIGKIGFSDWFRLNVSVLGNVLVSKGN
ncbi:hypothetical protein HHO41_21495 [Bacillus sp. DNRA2]|nr:hypothetical protein [Bacillus sp. DNRA2]NMD72800.1 hypothetical protein [Bacillus sp. DNRA2]